MNTQWNLPLLDYLKDLNNSFTMVEGVDEFIGRIWDRERKK
jgi:hypothetical protein